MKKMCRVLVYLLSHAPITVMFHPPSGLFMTGSGVQQPFATANGRNQSRAKKALKQIVAGGCAGQFIDVMPHLPHQRGVG